MNSNSIGNLRKELDKLELVNIQAALVNRNGLTILSNLPRNVDKRKFGAMGAALLGAMESAISTFSDSIINITVEFYDYQIIIVGINDELIIVSLAELNVDLGLIFIEIEECVKSIQNYKKGD